MIAIEMISGSDCDYIKAEAVVRIRKKINVSQRFVLIYSLLGLTLLHYDTGIYERHFC